MEEIRGLAEDVDEVLRGAGVRSRTRVTPDGVLVYEMYIPTQPRALVISARVALPGEEIGALFGKNSKFRRAAKAFAKKVAKSKVLKKLASVAKGIAKIVPPPFGTVLTTGIAAGTAAAKLARAARKGNPRARAFANAGAKKLRANLRSQVPDFIQQRREC